MALEFQYLNDLDLDFDLSLSGFESPEIDVVLQDLALDRDADSEDPADRIPAVVPEMSVTRPGDVWCVGNHRLICGDSTKAETYAAPQGDERAQMVFTDAPYNVPVSGHVCGSGRTKHRDFAMALGEMSKKTVY